MALSLAESQVVKQIAGVLYGFLPGTPHPRADQRISFPAVAYEVGLGEYWQGGSKLPAVTTLLQLTLERNRDRFCDLIKRIVERGLTYKKDGVAREDIEELNALIQKVRFKIPDLWDPSFLDSLPRRNPTAESHADRDGSVDYPALQVEFSKIMSLEPHARGLAFEDFLNGLFGDFGLSPRAAFRLVGEQIDGSFVLDSETYLVEAKWENKPTPQPDLLVFREKVIARATWARGVFISYTGFSEDGLTAFATGRSTNIVGLTGLDLYEVLNRSTSLIDVLRKKVRRAVETGEFYVPTAKLNL
jgi:hypothetical protein